jgi:WXG100 family type VII secretion target
MNRKERRLRMAGQIRITPDQMRSRANEYRREAENVQSVIGRMDALLSQLQGEWEGASSRAYASRFQELRPGFVQAKELVDEIARALDNTASTLEETDAQIAASLR